MVSAIPCFVQMLAKLTGVVVAVAADAMTERAFDQFIGDCDVHLHKLGFKIAQTIDQGIGGVKEYQGQPASKVDGSGGANDKGGNTEPRKEGTKWLALVRRPRLQHRIKGS